MTQAELQAIGIPLATFSAETILACEAGFVWLNENTTLEIDLADTEALATLPAGAKLFVAKYSTIINMPTGVVSESIDGLSQTFSSANTGALILDLARELVGSYMTSGCSFTPARRRWD